MVTVHLLDFGTWKLSVLIFLIFDTRLLAVLSTVVLLKLYLVPQKNFPFFPFKYE